MDEAVELQKYQPLVTAMVKVFIRSHRRIDYQDVRAEANIGLLLGLRRFDEKRGVPLFTWLGRAIGFRLAELAREYAQNWPVRRERRILKTHFVQGTSVAAATNVHDSISSRLLRDAEARIDSSKKLREMSDRNAQICRMFFVEGFTQKECGVALGLSPSRVSQILSAATAN